jgi:hypothetical protein
MIVTVLKAVKFLAFRAIPISDGVVRFVLPDPITPPSYCYQETNIKDLNW